METSTTRRRRPSRQEIRRATRAQLISSAISLFADRGVAATSLQDIAEEAGFSRGAFHSNFTDRTELLEAVVSQVVGDVGPALDAVLIADAPSTERLARYIHSFLTYCAEHSAEARALVAAVDQLNRTGVATYQARAEASLDGLVALFDDGRQRREMRKFDSRTMALLLRTVLDAEAARVGSESSTLSVAETIRELTTTFDLATRRTGP